MDRKEDRHKVKRNYLSGHEKRKKAKEKRSKLSNALKSIPNLKRYLEVLPKHTDLTLQTDDRQVIIYFIFFK